MASTAQEIDPVIEQTRELAHLLFGACIVGEFGWRRSGAEARATCLEHALRRGDAGLCGIIERLDAETFDTTWCLLVRRLELRGLAAMIEWLRRRSEAG